MTEPAPPPPTPRWVKVFAVIALLVVLALAALLVARGGEHGPGRHLPSAERTAPTP